MSTIELFKVQKTKANRGKKSLNAIEAPDDLKGLVDEWNEFKEQSKHFKGLQTTVADRILEFAQETFAKRLKLGNTENFKIEGNETIAAYIVQKSGSQIDGDDYEELCNKYGREKIDALIEIDYGAIKFDAEVLKANWDAVMGCLSHLPDAVKENLFKTTGYKVKPTVLASMCSLAVDEDQAKELITDLKIKNYLR